MKVPYSWLKELVPDAPPLSETVDLLAGLGLGVEEVVHQPGAPAQVIVAEVLQVSAIATSEHLKLALVIDGSTTYRVVCGAPNVAPGLRTALAKPGAVIEGVTVAARELAGVSSEGVLCSPRELALYDYGGGLLVLGDDAPLGQELAELWPGEAVITLELTPNRADAFSILGVARDLAAKLGVPYRHPAAELDTGQRDLPTGLRVIVEDPQGCPRFTLRKIEGVTVKPSPLWLQRRLAAIQVRPRNNVVDITNYVTFELGQPTHAYDQRALGDSTMVVRRARDGERLVALNEAALTLAPSDLLITTPVPGVGTRPIGVAGVIGGLIESVQPGTATVVLEAAHFDPVSVRRTAKRLNLATDAGYRFERGVDPNLPPLAAARIGQLLAELAGGRLHPGLTEVGSDQPPKTIAYRPSQVASLTALDVPLDAQRRFLTALGCRIAEGPDTWQVSVPSWRFDLAIAEDLIEEVARLHGYEHLPSSLPKIDFIPAESDVTHRGLRSLLVGMGLQEVITYVFASDEELTRAAAPAAVARLLNPPGAERSVLRTALYPSLLGVARSNHTLAGLALFEIGHVFGEREEERLAILLQGWWTEVGWLPGQRADFYVLKGLLDKLAQSLGSTLKVAAASHPALHPGVSAAVSWHGQAVGFMGKLHPAIAAHYELSEVYLAELTLPLSLGKIDFVDINRQPHAERDLAVLAPLKLAYAELERLVANSAGPWLESLTPFDVYQGEQLPAGQRSLALRLKFRHPERALRDQEVDATMTDIISTLRQSGYDIRG